MALNADPWKTPGQGRGWVGTGRSPSMSLLLVCRFISSRVGLYDARSVRILGMYPLNVFRVDMLFGWFDQILFSSVVFSDLVWQR